MITQYNSPVFVNRAVFFMALSAYPKTLKTLWFIFYLAPLALD